MIENLSQVLCKDLFKKNRYHSLTCEHMLPRNSECVKLSNPNPIVKV